MVWVIDGTRLKRDYPRFLKGTNNPGIFHVDFPDEYFLQPGSQVLRRLFLILEVMKQLTIQEIPEITYTGCCQRNMAGTLLLQPYHAEILSIVQLPANGR